LLVTLVAIALTLGVALYGLVSSRDTISLVGLTASAVIAVAMALRARDSIASAERASAYLDQALAESERVRDELRGANAALQSANVELRTLQIMVAQGFKLLDERSEGRLRQACDEAGDDLIQLVDQALESRRDLPHA